MIIQVTINSDSLPSGSFADVPLSLVGKPVRTEHIKCKKKRWLTTGRVLRCELVERFRYDYLRLELELDLPQSAMPGRTIRWDTFLQIEDGFLAVAVRPIIHKPLLLFFNDNPVPEF